MHDTYTQVESPHAVCAQDKLALTIAAEGAPLLLLGQFALKKACAVLYR